MGLFGGSKSSSSQVNIAPVSPVSMTGTNQSNTSLLAYNSRIAGGSLSNLSAGGDILNASTGATLMNIRDETYSPSMNVNVASPGATVGTSSQPNLMMLAIVAIGALLLFKLLNR